MTHDNVSVDDCINKYKILPEVINLVNKFDFEDFDKWIRDVFYGLKIYSKNIIVDDKLLQILEQLSLIFAYEQRSENLSEDSLEKLSREMMIDENTKRKLRSFFFESERYKSNKDIFEIKDILLNDLKRILKNEDYISIFSRIKNYKSLLCKSKHILNIYDNSIDLKKLSIDEILSKLTILKEKTSVLNSDYLDDLIGCNVIIDDSALSPDQAYKKMKKCAENVAKSLSKNGIKTKLIQKDFRGVIGVTSFSVYVFGLLDHDKLGVLPTRIYFQLKSIMYNSHPMFYIYKVTGEWEQPPWVNNVDFTKMITHRQCRQEIFNNFKSFFAEKAINSPFFLTNHLNFLGNNIESKEYFCKLLIYSNISKKIANYASALQASYDNLNELIGARFGTLHNLSVAEYKNTNKSLKKEITLSLLRSGYKINFSNLENNAQDIVLIDMADLKTIDAIIESKMHLKSNGIIIVTFSKMIKDNILQVTKYLLDKNISFSEFKLADDYRQIIERANNIQRHSVMLVIE